MCGEFANGRAWTVFSVGEIQPIVAFADSRKMLEKILKVLRRIPFLGRAKGMR